MLLLVYTHVIMYSELGVHKNYSMYNSDSMVVSGLCAALYLRLRVWQSLNSTKPFVCKYMNTLWNGTYVKYKWSVVSDIAFTLCKIIYIIIGIDTLDPLKIGFIAWFSLSTEKTKYSHSNVYWSGFASLPTNLDASSKIRIAVDYQVDGW
jgi:hypothetical protein